MSKVQSISAAAVDATRTLAQALSANGTGQLFTDVAPQVFCALLIERAIDRLTSAVKENTAALDRNNDALHRIANPDAYARDRDDDPLGENQG